MESSRQVLIASLKKQIEDWRTKLEDLRLEGADTNALDSLILTITRAEILVMDLEAGV